VLGKRIDEERAARVSRKESLRDQCRPGGISNRNIPELESLQVPENKADENS